MLQYIYCLIKYHICLRDARAIIERNIVLWVFSGIIDFILT